MSFSGLYAANGGPLPWERLAHLLETPALVLDLAEVRRRAEFIRVALPKVDHHFAIKALPVPEILVFLSELGFKFDAASVGELTILLRLGLDVSETLYTGPIITPRDLATAVAMGCRKFVVDSPKAVDRFREYAPLVELIVRLRVENDKTPMNLSAKFGCDERTAIAIFAKAAAAGLKVTGLSFSAGSQALEPSAHVRGIAACDALAGDYPYLTLLDIGGGFPWSAAVEGEELTRYFACIRGGLADATAMTAFAAEPGRFLVASCGTLVVTIVHAEIRDGRPWYFIDEGCYGVLSGIVFDYARYPVRPLCKTSRTPSASTIAGPTCDSLDVLASDVVLPRLDEGDRLIIGDVGAYSIASATHFNGIAPAAVHVLDSDIAECLSE